VKEQRYRIEDQFPTMYLAGIQILIFTFSVLYQNELFSIYSLLAFSA